MGTSTPARERWWTHERSGPGALAVNRPRTAGRHALRQSVCSLRLHDENPPSKSEGCPSASFPLGGNFIRVQGQGKLSIFKLYQLLPSNMLSRSSKNISVAVEVMSWRTHLYFRQVCNVCVHSHINLENLSLVKISLCSSSWLRKEWIESSILNE